LEAEYGEKGKLKQSLEEAMEVIQQRFARYVVMEAKLGGIIWPQEAAEC
jgi:hypothetical protein